MDFLETDKQWPILDVMPKPTVNTPLAICDQTGRPLPPKAAPPDKWLKCWFCKAARVQRRISANGNAFYITHKDDEHTHPVCTSERVKNKYLEFDNMRYTFHAAMTKNPMPSNRDHKLTDNREETVRGEELTMLAGLAKWGLYDCPDFKLNEQDNLSSIVLNSENAGTYFAAGPVRHLGMRAIVAKPDALDEAALWCRYVLEYKPDAESTEIRMYFYQVTTSRQLFDEIKNTLFLKVENGSGYVPKNDLTVIIYGDWNAHGCNRCKIRCRKMLSAECGEESRCTKFIYESLHTKRDFVYTRKAKTCVTGEK